MLNTKCFTEGWNLLRLSDSTKDGRTLSRIEVSDRKRAADLAETLMTVFVTLSKFVICRVLNLRYKQ